MHFLSDPWLQPTVISGRRPLFLRLKHNVRGHLGFGPASAISFRWYLSALPLPA